jgi:hypothetical protein
MTAADETAIAVLGWLAGEPELLGRFLALTGTDPAMLRTAVDDPGFMAALLDFVMDHEPTLLQFCEATGTKPEAVQRAYARLAGPRGETGAL